jgi:hypothetical protein
MMDALEGGYLFALVALALFIAMLPSAQRASLYRRVLPYGTTPLTTGEWLLAVLALAVLALTAMHPETRLLLLAVDAIGIDLFVFLLSLQARHGLRIARSLVEPLVDAWYRQIWLPGYRLNWRTSRDIPLVAVYAVSIPALLAAPLVLIALKCVRNL